MLQQILLVDDAIEKYPEKILAGIHDRIGREHTLLSARMGWLLTLNIILFAPFFVTIRDTSSRINEVSNMLLGMCLMGIFTTIVLFITMSMAIHTMDVLRQRESSVYRRIKHNLQNQDSVEDLEIQKDCQLKLLCFQIMDPDKPGLRSHTMTENLPSRYQATHYLSMYAQLALPIAVLISWIACFAMLA